MDHLESFEAATPSPHRPHVSPGAGSPSRWGQRSSGKAVTSRGRGTRRDVSRYALLARGREERGKRGKRGEKERRERMLLPHCAAPGSGQGQILGDLSTQRHPHGKLK